MCEAPWNESSAVVASRLQAARGETPVARLLLEAGKTKLDNLASFEKSFWRLNFCRNCRLMNALVVMREVFT